MLILSLLAIELPIGLPFGLPSDRITLRVELGSTSWVENGSGRGVLGSSRVVLRSSRLVLGNNVPHRGQ